MTFNTEFIKAQTHGSEYLMHKYWARKPHNVISHCIQELTEENDVIIDPFCGSGVTLREGALLGRKCIGFDINPIAILISKVLLYPPKADDFLNTFNKIYNKALNRYGYLYKTNDNKSIKYVAHKIISQCQCGKLLTKDECIKKGRNYICPHCNEIVHFNLESMVDTKIFNIIIDGDKSYSPSEEEIQQQRKYSNFNDSSVDTASYDYTFPENKRILAFKGIHTSDFFTKRNFCILCYFANEIWKIQDEKIRNCSLLLLTSSVAQCSRLIASRNNLTTGGPAWSVPGFWVPAEHFESNPFIHIKARIVKYKKALKKLENSPIATPVKLYKGDSLNILNSDSCSKLKADLIFLDPPYGDSVPYTEFSNLWNSFLKDMPSFSKDISVSDRIDKTQSWDNYKEKLNEYMKCFTNHLNDDGKLLITFNNNDVRAWESLISSLQNNGFICEHVFYQIPAVISSKAHLSITSSYISDIYSVYIHDPSKKPSENLTPLLTHLCLVANSRGGTVSKTIIDREFFIFWLKTNINYTLLKNKDDILKSIFNYNRKDKIYSIKDSYKSSTIQLKSLVRKDLNSLLDSGENDIYNCYIKIASDYQQYGTIEFWEFEEYTKDYAKNNNKIYGLTQLDLFSTSNNV